jgi:hypothetical protein
VVLDNNSNPIQNSPFPSDNSTAPFPVTAGVYTIKVDYTGNGVGAIPMSLIG